VFAIRTTHRLSQGVLPGEEGGADFPRANFRENRIVTPQGIASLLRIAKAPIPNADRRPSSTIDDKQRDRLQLEQVKYAFFSGGPLTFRVDIATDIAKSAQQPVTTLLFKWAGDWKLSRLILPLDAIQNIADGRRP
jgi:hypothetical protein